MSADPKIFLHWISGFVAWAHNHPDVNKQALALGRAALVEEVNQRLTAGIYH